MAHTYANTYDVIVIGGGISGLYAAHQLLYTKNENDSNTFNKVLLVEKQSRLGGRIHTIYENGYQYEAGAGRFSSKHKRLLGLLDRFGLHKVRNEHNLEYRHTTQTTTSTLAPIKSTVTSEMIINVIQSAKTMEKQDLVNMTFKELCMKVVGAEKTEFIQSSFGYNAEFEILNAADACEMFSSDFKGNITYYSCTEGLSRLVDSLEKELLSDKHKRCTINKEMRINRISWDKQQSVFNVQAIAATGKVMQYTARIVISAIPQKELLEWDIFTAEQRKVLNSVSPVSLHRIYGAWPVKVMNWFTKNNIPKTTTDNHVRQFIPINRQIGLAMLSYSDSKDADYWRRVADRGLKSLTDTLLRSLRSLFSPLMIPAPDWVQSHYWPQGIHLWRKKSDSTVLTQRIQRILGHDVPFYVIGEAFCKHQGWIEGALESVDVALSDLGVGVGGGATMPPTHLQYIKSHQGVLKKSNLKEFRSAYPDIEWVLYTDDDNITHMIDVTQWKWLHPGGSSVYDNYMYGDITKVFHTVPYHLQASTEPKLKNTVHSALKKYTIAKILDF